MERGQVSPSSASSIFALLFVPFLLATFLLVAAEPASAQYFGRNKVQYDDFDFYVVETENFRIHVPEDMSDQAVEDVSRMAERWYGRLSRTLQHAFRQGVKKPIIFYANQPDFQQTNAIPGFISQATGGVTEGIKNRVIMPFAETYGETDHVLGHELVHAFQYDMASAQRGGGSTGFRTLPLWAVEGLAEYLSVGRTSPHTAMWMRDAVLRDDLPTIRDLARGQYFPYRYGHAVWAFIGGQYGDEAVTAFYRSAAGLGLQRASEGVFGIPLDTLSRQWQEATREHFTPTLEGRMDPREVGSQIVPSDGPGFAISPSVSPDGERVVYMGRRDIFTVDMYVADTRTGEVLGRLATANANPHFDALAFLNSTGTWSPDGSRFAFTTYANGDNQIAVADVSSRSVETRFPLEGIGAVFSLDWSPDGEHIVFSGSVGGVNDLYRLDVDDQTVEQLTDDRWSQLHPAYSPDGTQLAFATDQGSPADLEALSFPSHGLGIMSLETGEVTVERPFANVKHIDPEWSPDGSSLYFISDRNGFSDVYRLSLGDGTLWRVTRVATGVTGVTDLAPALTVADQGGEVLFTVFSEGEYMVRRLSAQASSGEEVQRIETEDLGAGMLPPMQLQPPQRVATYLGNPTGLPDPAGFTRNDYDADLSLDYVAQPTAGIAVDRLGTSLGGSVAAFFSDMLGNHQLGVALQAQGSFQDIGGQAAYSFLGDRTNWRVQGGRIPYRQTFFARGTGTIGGQEVPTADLIIDRTIVNRASTGIQYPFSTTRRFETDVGATLLTFDREAIRTYLDPSTGQPIGRERVELDSPPSMTLYNVMGALVEDRSFMGLTSPVRGARARLEVEQNFGELSFTNVLADYRRYFFFNPVTFAFRGFHLGRYGADSETGLINPLFLGFERYVRGYSAGSFESSAECTPVPGSPDACPEIDRLIGSRMAVGNVEFRVPVIGVEEFGILDWGFIPTEITLFTDAGVAWTEDESPDLEFARESTERIPVFSSGVSARLNVLGRAVVEVYWAYPFQRPGKGGVWGFQLAPGW
ncbi:MAG: BamA/TamA family outer membrane protein [Longimicrobiales bacterium]|nr:BamA/TamA family outer membrane protein [Longimicrobiales bacterium]